jgi:TusA-related sulfurtransferase
VKTVDACGISCPEPLLMLKNALKSEKEVVLFVDSECALENCEKYVRKENFSVNVTIDVGGRYKMCVVAMK